EEVGERDQERLEAGGRGGGRSGLQSGGGPPLNPPGGADPREQGHGARGRWRPVIGPIGEGEGEGDEEARAEVLRRTDVAGPPARARVPAEPASRAGPPPRSALRFAHRAAPTTLLF